MPEKINNKPQFGYEDWKKEQYTEPEKNVIFTLEKFPCSYCDKEYDNLRGMKTHGTWCEKNPNARAHKYKIEEGTKISEHKYKTKRYTIEEINEIDKVCGLSDSQIAKFVRGDKK